MAGIDKRTGFSFRLERAGLDAKLKKAITAATDARPFFARVVGMMQDSIAEEFAGEFYKSPEGGTESWAPRKPFGTANEQRGERLLFTTGTLMRAWTESRNIRVTNAFAGIGLQKGISVQSGDTSVPLEIIAAVHRGGLSKIPRRGFTKVLALEAAKSRDPWPLTHPKGWAMYWKIRKAFGVNLSMNKLRGEGIRIPSRPHAAMNPALAAEIKDAAREWLSRQKLTKGKRGRA